MGRLRKISKTKRKRSFAQNGFTLKAGELTFELRIFFIELGRYLYQSLHLSFIKFEKVKGVFVTILYRQRGKYARRFMHSGMAGLAALGIIIAPVVADEFPGRTVDPWDIPSPSLILSA